MDFFGPDTAPFAIALLVTAGIALLEIVGLLSGFSASSAIDNALPDFDIEAEPALDADSPPDVAEAASGPLSALLSWLSFGRVPALVVLILFLTGFGLFGFIEQETLRRSFGFMLHPLVASVPALFAGALCARHGGRLLARLIPREESDAVSTSGFVGRIATIIRGEARQGFPAEAKLKDLRGKTHYLLVEPDTGEPPFGQGSQVLVIGQTGSVYRAITKLKPTQPTGTE